MSSTSTVPYENATSGEAARAETTKILQRLGCNRIGWMDDYEARTVLLRFEVSGRAMQLEASAMGYAKLWLKAHPYNRGRMRVTELEHRGRALAQGAIAVNSILRDWVKGQVTAIECGVVTLEQAFMPLMIGPDGRKVADVVLANLLPPPEASHDD